MLRESEASELLEFGLALPLILVMIIGMMDFAHAYHVKQELANAAREGARLGATEKTYASVQSIYDDVTAYLQDAGVNTTSFQFSDPPSQGTCNVPVTSGSTVTVTSVPCWVYTSSSNYGLKTLEIERTIPMTASGMAFNATRVKITYLYDWTYGFNHIINLLVPSASVSSTIEIGSDAMMANQGS